MLQEVSHARSPGIVTVVLLAHNEVNLIEPFLNHYRRICHPHFAVVDDRSDDGTAELLRAQPDVTLYRPAVGSSYGQHKLLWRAELLDRHSDGDWALTPDLDEHLVFPRMEERLLADYLARLDAEGAEGVLTVMVDMYADRPLGDHRFPDGSSASLAEAFPLFDGPAPAPLGYHFSFRRKQARRMPTPLLLVHGGMRDRIFRVGDGSIGRVAANAIDRVGSLDGPVTPKGARLAAMWLARRLTGDCFREALEMQKIGLIRWRKGLRYGNAHRLRDRLKLSESIAAFLHYKFTRGIAGLEYTAGRGQHAAGADHYHAMLRQREALSRSPVFPGTRRFETSASLAGIIRDIPRP